MEIQPILIIGLLLWVLSNDPLGFDGWEQMPNNKITRIEFSCPVCGSKFYRVPSQMKDGRTPVCSVKCRSIFIRVDFPGSPANLKLIGKRINSCVVLEIQEEVLRKGGRDYWLLCRCDCGKIKRIRYASFMSKTTISCGCWRIKRLSERQKKRPYEAHYNLLLRLAKKYKREVSFSYEEFLGFTKITECMYCGAHIEWLLHGTNDVFVGAYYLDRKDNSSDYTLENSGVCCIRCNLSKGDRFTQEEWTKIGEVIRSFSKEKA
jgi:5-methylcytosine-specific restriction endonuclease McrA